MKLSRDFTNKINWILDNLLPPFVRDSRFIMSPLFLLLFGKKGKLFLNFKENAWEFNSTEMANYYKELASVHIKRETDLNLSCEKYILNKIKGDKVLDIACGRGYLAKKIQQKEGCEVVGIDFVIPDELKNSKNISFQEGIIEDIKYPNNFFDTVISTHTLEHVLDLEKCITELRRVAAKRLIVVLPKQRPYRFTFDLHLQFFPYKYNVLKAFGNVNGNCVLLDNDWLYIEDL
ncbi:class I SAM-dependent methyltransferase [Neotamlana laminarinivorans]|uniref:Methyltransferase domain-containing protein n=1 Tax=Neotamlana laminarinivorans TaxID=2883124 RepID=A0A9X1I3G9_9FLAO|nr:class I SAM-dependent methyltransferase [Tamlana laminarinivorans]MCB4799702.1 methyltransferase domain-containing protein [Tamlana laminarinivorans]